MSAPRTGDRTHHTHILLLRGINVGKTNRVAKDTLIRWAEEAGARDRPRGSCAARM